MKLLVTYLPLLPSKSLHETTGGIPNCSYARFHKTESCNKMNVLKKFVSDLSEKSGCGVHYTNHSLRETSITRMWNGGVLEKAIPETSGHKSLKAL